MTIDEHAPNSPGEGYRFLQPGETVERTDEEATYSWYAIEKTPPLHQVWNSVAELDGNNGQAMAGLVVGAPRTRGLVARLTNHRRRIA